MGERSDLVLGVVPARGGSKGLTRKNLREIKGVPLVGRAVQDLATAKVCDVVVVSTDDVEIADVARQFGAQVPFLRDEEISGDLATTESTLTDALERTEAILGLEFSICIYVSSSEFARSVPIIREGVARLRSDRSLESVFAVARTHKNYWELGESGAANRLASWMSEYSSRQIRRPLFVEHTGIACVSRAETWRAGRRIGDRVGMIELPNGFPILDIHEQADLEIANLLADFFSSATNQVIS